MTQPDFAGSPRIYMARLFHESNTFAPGATPGARFRVRKGNELLAEGDDGSVLGAVIQRGRRHGQRVLPGFDVSASPSATPEDAVVETAMCLLDETLPQAVEHGLDGIFLQLHGAIATPSHPDPEGALLTRIATHLGDQPVPVAAVLDLHANVSPAMIGPGRVLCAYRENPHTDAVESGLRTMKFLEAAIHARKRYATALVQVPILLPPPGTATAQNPMAGLLRRAREMECAEVPIISICPGFAHADTPDTGLSFQVVWDPETSRRPVLENIARELAGLAWQLAPAGYPDEMELETAVAAANASGGHPALIVEPADNIGGGAGGDATWVLAEFVRQRVRGGGVIIADPGAVCKLRGTSPGDIRELTVGGSHPELSGPAVTLKVKMIRQWDGVFEVEDPQSHIVAITGRRVDMGECCLLESGGITLLLTSNPTPPMDLGQWRCAGISPENLRLIGVKAAVAHRRAYDRIARRSFTVSTPGPCTSRLETLPYRRLRRPMHPLDPVVAGFVLHGGPLH